MDIYSIMLTVFLVLNIILAVFVIFLERRDAGATWAWLMVLFFIPLLGFFMYLFFGQNLTRRKMFQWEDRKKFGIDELLNNQIKGIKAKDFRFQNNIILKCKDLIYMHLVNNDAVLTQDNSVTIFTDGREKFDSLIRDITEAKDHIHLQYYIFKRDNLGRSLINLLTEKAKEGVKVRVLYDELGSRSLHKKVFKELMAAGGEIEAFFPSRLHFINLRINYRNHRKLAIIDGKIGYVGGFNVGDEYLGLNPRFGYWRDTHLRIEGSAVHSMQTRFILDWNQASHRHDIYYAPEFFPRAYSSENVGMQIVTSGPDSEWEQIKNGYIKMISSARKSIYIQTPYFIPDASVLDALRIAALSGVEVNIMIPNKPDHMFVYWATFSYVGEMLKADANIYIYENGFIHAKTLIVDEEVSSVGTANIDVRSFRLNFEVNAFIYDREVSRNLTESFKEDIQLSRKLTAEDYSKRALKIKLKESVSRLLSPIL
ncbi:cardiolipin synthase [Bacillus sp. ISL-47]|uniref:cardiolipin synthase n=1 Tax=Bacillus sp. ISL-47 TaxID=2819130 RepID=UPI001BE6D03B|nr:cardiolipin synthase [Bacillus sp. ISL-47]MBT2690327.1 cardiolipin synthase [Bacillus sp. ISL-47]MBT2706523.1 cardiolipin synthase [Pseudomonas sp. ISL-84]